MRNCDHCKGRGVLTKSKRLRNGTYDYITVTCHCQTAHVQQALKERTRKEQLIDELFGTVRNTHFTGGIL